MCSNIYGYIRSNYIIIALIVHKSHLSLYLLTYRRQSRRLEVYWKLKKKKEKLNRIHYHPGKEDTDDSVDTTQGNYTMIISL